MLGKSNEKPCNTIDTLIGAKADLKGDISFSGGLRVDGKVTVPHMIINGRINGNVHCSERIELQPKAEVNGDVHYKVIEMALGAAINGNLVHETGQAAEKGAVTKLKSVAASAGESGAEGDS